MLKTVFIGVLAVCTAVVSTPNACAGEVYFIWADASSVTLREEFPDSVFFGAQELGLRSYSGRNSHIVMRLDIGAFTPPVGGVLDTAEIGMYVIRSVSGEAPSREVDVHALTTAYEASTATWQFPWNNPGGDYDEVWYTSVDIPNDYEGWIVWDVTDLLRESWVELETNGILFKYRQDGLEAPGAICGFTSGAVKSTSPYLKLVYDFPSGAADEFDAVRDEVVNLVNAPNPFNTATEITFTIERRQCLQLNIYNLLGQDVVQLHDGVVSPGTHTIHWDAIDSSGRNLPAGIYFCRLRTESGELTRRMILLK